MSESEKMSDLSPYEELGQAIEEQYGRRDVTNLALQRVALKHLFDRRTRLAALKVLLDERDRVWEEMRKEDGEFEERVCPLCGVSFMEAVETPRDEFPGNRIPFSRGWCGPCHRLINSLEESIQRRPYGYSTIPLLGGECAECGGDDGFHYNRCQAVL